MTDLNLSLVCTASSPTQAKLFVAMLAAEGIPALVDGDSLADEVAISRRLMNLAGTQIKVPTAALARAREILANCSIDEEELCAQAIAAGPNPEVAVREPRVQPHWPFFALGLMAGALGAWLAATNAAAAPPAPTNSAAAPAAGPSDPFWEMTSEAFGLRQRWKSDGAYYTDMHDENRDGFYELVVEHYPSGASYSTRDRDGNGRYDEYTMQDPGGLTVYWRDTDNSGVLNEAIVRDRNGQELQRLRWVPGKGYELAGK